MNQIERIGLLLKVLRTQKCTTEALREHLLQKTPTISLRQLQRDLNDLAPLLRADEYLDRIKENKKIYYVIQKKEKEATAPILPSKIVSTQFYTQPQSAQNLKLLQELSAAIAQHLIITIVELKNDVTGDNAHFETDAFTFYPVQLIEHHGSYYLGGWQPKRKVVQLFEINQLAQLRLSSKPFNFAQAKTLFETEYQKRFGVTKNINSAVYDIQIQMPKIVADFIQKSHWHPSQRFTKKGNQVIMHLHCGINRELMNWLFMWLYNIRVIAPAALVHYYQKTIHEIQQNSHDTLPMVYRNIFEEKESGRRQKAEGRRQKLEVRN